LQKLNSLDLKGAYSTTSRKGVQNCSIRIRGWYMGSIKTTKELKNERIIENLIAHDFFDA
jgi:hypothetical protein